MHLAQVQARTDYSTSAFASEQCLLAKQLENIGNYEGARAALSGLWNEIGQPPNLEGLDRNAKAELLLRVGTLSGWIGSANQIPNAQSFAKDLISQAIRAFKALRNSNKVSEAETDLAICYWREGAMDEARVLSKEALDHANSPQTKARAFINQAVIEVADSQLNETLRLLNEAAPLVETLDDHAAKGRYHTILAVALKRTATPENLDRALIEYTAATFHFEQAGHTAYVASGENNISCLLLEFQRYREAHQHLDNAYRTFTQLRDRTKAAQTYETRARIYIAQERYKDADKQAAIAVRSLAQSKEYSLLSEALTTRAISLAKLEQYTKSLTLFRQATEIANDADDPRSAIRAKIATIKELGAVLKPLELVALYIELDQQISNTQDLALMSQLRTCAAITIQCLQPVDISGITSPTLSLREKLHRYEALLMTDALTKSKGKVTSAARLLGMTHQGLIEALEGRQKGLRIKEPIRRRRSIAKLKKQRN